jgi:hypothetical protein
VIRLALGNIPERVQALLTGAVDAVDLNHPGDVIVMRNGFKALWDLRKEVNYPSMSVVTRRKFVKEDRDTVLRSEGPYRGDLFFEGQQGFQFKGPEPISENE